MKNRRSTILSMALLAGVFCVASAYGQCQSSASGSFPNFDGQSAPHTYNFPNLCQASSFVTFTLRATADLGCNPNDATNCNSGSCCHCDTDPTLKYVTLRIGPAGALITSANTDPD